MVKNFHPVYICLVGFVILLLGLIFGWYAFPLLEHYLISQNIALKDGNPTYNVWRDPSFPIKMKVYFFNVTNPDEVSNGGRPIIKDLGPYVYDEWHKKKILSINEANDTIEYNQTKLYFFNRKDSGARSEEDVVTIINTGLLGMVIQIAEEFPMALSLLDDAFPLLYPGIKDVFTRDTVRNILFDGILLHCTEEEVDMICSALRSKRPPSMRLAENGQDLLISMFHYLNNTEDGPFLMQRGFKTDQRGEIISYQTYKNIPTWGGKNSCSTVHGTDLSIVKTYETIPEKIDFFAEDLCRPLYANFNEEKDFDGLITYKFIATDAFGSNTTLEECYCSKERKKGGLPKCGPVGTMAMGPCLHAPIYVSMPYFYMAEQHLKDYIRNLDPDEENYKTIIITEPKTGSPISVKTRIQMNIPLRKFEGVALFENVSEGLFPIIWIEKGGKIPEDLFDQLKDSLSKLNKLEQLKWVLIGFGVIVMLIGFLLSVWKEVYKGNNKTNPFNNNKLYPQQWDPKHIILYPKQGYRE